ncbi:MAG: hypothetical protein JSV93_03475 [Candidatus Omnitrophota bacterium]|nr:MAG: hypothetical protein JSV93_03475 [Candidatus Omnitrophota bacterium]
MKKIKIKISGRPGWHIECSVMSQKFLKTDTVDIHAGGRDLIFPHHENEIAQSEAFTGKQFAKYWIHNALLTTGGQKMSKSLGNFITIKNFQAKHKNLDLLKLLFISSHYRSPVDYTEEKIEEMKKKYEKFSSLFRELDKQYGTRDPKKLPTGSNAGIKKIRQDFENAMDDDFNTPLALSVLLNLVKGCNRILHDDKSNLDRTLLRSLKETIDEFAKILGLSFENIPKIKSENRIFLEESYAYAKEIIKLVRQREKARKNKDFEKADRIKKELLKKGIIVEDTKEGPVCRKKI